MEQAAELALEPSRNALDHMERSRRCAVWARLDNATSDERDQAVNTVWAALIKLPPECSDAQMQQARDQEIARIQAQILKRRAEEKAAKAAKEKAAAKQWLREYSRREFDFYLIDLNVAGKLKESAATLARGELKATVLQDLEQELDGSESTQDARRLMQEITREALGIE